MSPVDVRVRLEWGSSGVGKSVGRPTRGAILIRGLNQEDVQRRVSELHSFICQPFILYCIGNDGTRLSGSVRSMPRLPAWRAKDMCGRAMAIRHRNAEGVRNVSFELRLRD